MKTNLVIKLPSELTDNTYALGSALAPMSGFSTAYYECFACGEQWEIPRDKSGRLPSDYWKCPHGCNELLARGIHSIDDAVKGVALLADYLTGYAERVETIYGTVYADPTEATEDVLEELKDDSPAWGECIDALQFLMSNIVLDIYALSHPHGPIAARHLSKLLTDFFIGMLNKPVFNEFA